MIVATTIEIFPIVEQVREPDIHVMAPDPDPFREPVSDQKSGIVQQNLGPTAAQTRSDIFRDLIDVVVDMKNITKNLGNEITLDPGIRIPDPRTD
jgi:hypothetical protein